MSATKAYDIKINGKGYILSPGSSMGKMQLSAEKVGQGTPGYGDLSDQEAWAQSDWRGGFDQKFDLDRSRFLNSHAIEVMDHAGSLRIAKKFNTTAATQTSVYGGYVNFSGFYFGHTGNVLVYTTDFQSYVSAVNVSATVNDHNMVVFNDKLYVGSPSKALWASSNPTSQAAWSAEQSGTYSIGSMDIMGNLLYASNTGKKLLAYDGVSFSEVVSNKKWKILKIRQFNGRIYLGCMDEDELGRIALRVFDGTTDYTIQEWTGIARSDLAFSVMETFGSKLYFSINPEYFNAELYSFDGDSVDFEFNVNARDPEKVAGAFTEDIALHFTTMDDMVVSDGKLWLSVTVAGAEVSPTGYHELYCSPNGNYWYRYYKFDATNRAPATGSNSKLFAYRNSSNNVLGFVRGPDSAGKEDVYRADFNSTAVESSGRLDSSVIDMDIFSIDKMPSVVEVYHQTMPASASVTVNLLNFLSTVNTATVSNNTQGSTLTTLKMNGNSGKKFQYQVVLSAGAQTPIVDDIVVRYIIAPDFKKTWTLEVVATDNIELRDKTREKRSGAEIMRDLFNAADNGIVQFVDVDGVVYDQNGPKTTNRGVIVRDIQRRFPYPLGLSGPEALVTLVLTEA